MNDHSYNRALESSQASSPSNRPRVEIPGDLVGANEWALGGPLQLQPRVAAPRSPCPQRGKIVKSKSSPSSLTTHKFGLRPTPSPPRLIIDHQTGDIIESYPENPVYLRTYQPIEATDDEEDNEERGNENSDDHEHREDHDHAQNQIGDSPVAQPSPAIAERAPKEREGARGSDRSDQLQPAGAMSNSLNPRPSEHLHRPAKPAVIPPPHAGKVYFESAPGASLFEQRISAASPPQTSDGSMSPRERARASFRRALNTLADAERTDIAIVTEPDELAASSAPTPGQIRVTATSAARGNALLAAQQQQQQQQQQPRHSSTNVSKLYGQPPPVSVTRDNRKQVYQPIEATLRGVGGGAGTRAKGPAVVQHQQPVAVEGPPTLDKSSLYNFCYNCRVLLVILLSSLIIYLLTGPLELDCMRHRPTYAYVSLISSSVNLITITIFSLFWYCNGITRTLYQNVSASAFMVTSYLILVCVNLALAILFFFIDTCHFQRLLANRPALSEFQVSPHETTNLGSPERLIALRHLGDTPPYDRHRAEARLALEAIESIEHLLGPAATTTNRQTQRHSRRQVASPLVAVRDDGDADDDAPASPRAPSVIDDQLELDDVPSTTPSSTTTPSGADLLAEQYNQEHAHVPKMSPWEAFWEYLKEQARVARHGFHRFLMTYDLKFVGALHALLAACFQYLAMKVAVVRSFFSARPSLA